MGPQMLRTTSWISRFPEHHGDLGVGGVRQSCFSPCLRSISWTSHFWRLRLLRYLKCRPWHHAMSMRGLALVLKGKALGGHYANFLSQSGGSTKLHNSSLYSLFICFWRCHEPHTLVGMQKHLISKGQQDEKSGLVSYNKFSMEITGISRTE